MLLHINESKAIQLSLSIKMLTSCDEVNAVMLNISRLPTLTYDLNLKNKSVQILSSMHKHSNAST